MNVTEIIKKEEVKNILKKEIKYPEIKLKKEMKYYKNPENHSLIGIAYEIVFQIEYMKKNKLNNMNYIKAYRKIEYLTNLKEKVSDIKKEKINKIINNLKKIEKNIKNYIFNKGKINYKNIFYLAWISNIRMQKQLKIKDIYLKKDVKDLKILKKGIKRFKKILKNEIKFNVYEKKEDIVGEIDIKNKRYILDIKTVIEGKVNEYMINQLIMYYLISKNEEYKPKKIGILFSRFGKIKFVKIRKILSKKGEKRLIKQLL